LSVYLLLSLSLSYTGNRGVTGNVLILEEAAFMDREIFYKLILPLMGVNGTVVIAISTPDDNGNYYSELLTLKNPDDTPLFRCIKVGLACDRCTELGRARQCPHKAATLPRWKSVMRSHKIEAIMRNDPKTFAREQGGQIVDDDEKPLAPFVPRLRELPLYKPQRLIERVDIGIDPSAGGPSEFTLVSTYWENGYRAICGISAKSDYRIDTIEELIAKHLTALREHEKFAAATFYIFVEYNLSFIDADIVRRFVQDPKNNFGPVVVPSFDTNTKKNRPGIPTSHQAKISYTTTMTELMRQERLRISYYTIGRDFDGGLRKLYDQMNAWTDYYKASDGGLGPNKRIMSGKRGNRQDDTLIGLMISHFYGLKQFHLDLAHV
jgi:hypothetical protein